MKKKLIETPLLLIFILFFKPGTYCQNEDPLVPILAEELFREFNELKTKEIPAYYMEIRVEELNSHNLQSNLGSLIARNSHHVRTFLPFIRVGDYSFDNTHSDEMAFPGFEGHEEYNYLPLENHPDAIRYNIWNATKNLYNKAIDELIGKQESRDTFEKDTSGDFTKEESVKYFEPVIKGDFSRFDLSPWQERINRYTASFKELDEISASTCEFKYQLVREYFLNTEGSVIVQNQSFCELAFTFLCRSSEDEIIPFSKSFYARTPDKLPSDEEILGQLEEVKSILRNLIKAPKGEPYTGPAILSAEASGVFFHEIFGHRIEGQRFSETFNSNTFKDKIGQKVINESISVTSDPTLTEYDGKDLMGYYLYDNQGIAAQRVVNVENGILKEFLMSRKPVDSFEHSNGHGRASIGFEPVTRQSNMFVTTSEPAGMEVLRKNLIKECKKQKLPYGYYFKTVSGGFTNTMNFMPDFFNIIPTEVYKIYTDGRPDELIRGVNLIGTPMIMFSEILATGDTPEVFSGMCGAESGPVPVSTISPSMLVRKIETQNQFVFEMERPILPDPEKQIIETNK